LFDFEACLEDQSVTGRTTTEADAKMQCHIIAKADIGGGIVLMLLEGFLEHAVVLEAECERPADLESSTGTRLPSDP